MMVDGIGEVWAASVLQRGEQTRAHRARRGVFGGFAPEAP